MTDETASLTGWSRRLRGSVPHSSALAQSLMTRTAFWVGLVDVLLIVVFSVMSKKSRVLEYRELPEH